MIIDKTKWKPVKLGDITVKKEENDKSNSFNKFSRFLKVEHLDAESLRVKRWGNVGEDELPPTFYKIFRKGQVLYPTRNPHLKRVALASFDGICGEKTLTLEPISPFVDGNFFPFIFLSQSFQNHTTGSIVGSTNPHVRWRDVAEFKFLLPPMELQVILAELLWAADEVIETYKLLLLQLENTYAQCIEALYVTTEKRRKINEVAFINKHSLSNNTPSNYKFKYLDIASIVEPKVYGDLHELEFVSAPSRARRIVQDGDIVLSLVRPYFKSFVIIIDAKDIIASTGTAVLSIKEGFDRNYIFHSFFTKKFVSFCETRMNGTNYPAITPNDLKIYEIPDLPLKTQIEIGNKLNSIDQECLALKTIINQAKEIQKVIINQIFS